MNPDVVVDARGLHCPLPVIRLAATARDRPPGALISISSTDPAAGPDISAWCRLRGHELVEQHPAIGEALVSLIRLR